MAGYYLQGLPTTLVRIPQGIEGIKITMRLMRLMVQRWKLDPGIRALAKQLVDGCAQGDFSCEVRALQAFVRDQIRYVGDIADVETLQTPRATLEQASGDCDDKGTLAAALLEAINHKTRFIAAAFEPGVFSHVWLETLIGPNWYPLETTRPVPAGWQPPPGRVFQRIVAHN